MKIPKLTASERVDLTRRFSDLNEGGKVLLFDSILRSADAKTGRLLSDSFAEFENSPAFKLLDLSEQKTLPLPLQ